MLVNAVIALNIKELEKAVLKMALNSSMEQEFAKHIERILKFEPNYFNYSPYDSFLAPFSCPAIPPSKIVKSVHELRPSDIKAVAALGDSLTAGLGSNAKTVIGLLFEYRGESWSIGADSDLDQIVTMPNILRKYSNNLAGASRGNDFALFDKRTDSFNVAVSGQEANHIPDQARALVERMKQSKDFDYKNDWKLVTLFIGGNDLCDLCKDNVLHTPEAYINYIKEGLDILYNELPKTFVNLVTVLRVDQIQSLNEGLICKVLHHFECPCAAYPKDANEEKILKETFEQYVNYTLNLVDSNRYEKDDFTVVVQPFMEDMQVPRTQKGDVDLSYFAPDCFHFSRKGHAQSAIALWNNMFTSVGKKAKKWDLNEQILCPSLAQPYLCTKKNC